jgi:hypothetical protein
METLKNINERRKQLLYHYKTLIEESYNLRETDSALSDIQEYNAIKTLEEIHLLNFLSRT